MLALPWKELAPIEPKAGTSFGFCVLVNDCDKDYRKRALTLTPPDTEPYMRPDLYPVMTLEEGDGK